MSTENQSAYQQAKLEIPKSILESDKLRDGAVLVMSGLALYACAVMGVEKATEIMPMISAGMLVGSMMLDAQSTVTTIETAARANNIGIESSVAETGLFLPPQPTSNDIYFGRGLLIDIAKIVLLVGAPIIGPLGLIGPLAGIGHSAGKTLASLNNRVVNRRLERAIEIRSNS